MLSPGLDPQDLQRPARVLLVEDDPQVRSALRQKLAAGGHQVIAIGSGDQPEVVLSSGVDLLVAEVSAARPEALAFLQKARRAHPALSILATSKAAERGAALDAGADEVEERPVDPARLLGKIDRLLDRGPPQELTTATERVPAAQEEAQRGYELSSPGSQAGAPKLVQEAEAGSLRDTRTKAYVPAFFLEYAARELQRSQRYGRPFGIATLRLSDPERLRRDLGEAALRDLLRAMVAAVSRTARDVDVVAHLDQEELGVILPETDHFGALMFQRRLLMAVAEDKEVAALHARVPFSLEVGAATHARDGKTLEELLARCRERALQGKRSLARGLEALGFWESIEELLEGRHQRGASTDPLDPVSRVATMEAEVFHSIRAEVLREVARDPGGRGLLYLSAGPELLQAALPALEALSGGSQWTFHLLGKRGPSALHHPAVTPVYVDAEDPIVRHDLLLFLSERTAYGLVRRAGDAGPAFHSSDAPLISHLVTRLHQAYDLHSF